MANKHYNGGSGDFTAAANWGGVAPADTDSLYIDETTTDLTTNVTATGLDDATVHVGPNYTGKLGGAGNVLELGDDCRVVFNGRLCPVAYISSASGGSLTIKSTNRTPAALVISGDWTDVYQLGGSLTVAAGTTIERLHVFGQRSYATIAAGCTIGTIEMRSGLVESASAADAVNIRGGKLRFESDSALTLPAVLQTGGTIIFWSPGGVVSSLSMSGGVFTTSGRAFVSTIAAGIIRSGASAIGNNSTMATLTQAGGVIRNMAAASSLLVVAPPLTSGNF